MLDYQYEFSFEKEFRHDETRKWMISFWKNGFYYCAAYIFLIFAGQWYMSKRSKFELRGILGLWNILLALFSIIGLSRTAPELIHVLRHNGLYHSICIPSFIEHDRVAGFWTLMFVLSKLPELGDTFFIILRKQPLIFLHWYHHVTVLLYSWFSYTEYTASARWFIVMNYCAHSVMYTYYALKAMSFNPTKWIAMMITALQITQMVIGCLINVWTYQYKKNQIDCHVSEMNVMLSSCMYLSYFILFAIFFYRTYLDGRRSKVLKRNEKSSLKMN